MTSAGGGGGALPSHVLHCSPSRLIHHISKRVYRSRERERKKELCKRKEWKRLYRMALQQALEVDIRQKMEEIRPFRRPRHHCLLHPSSNMRSYAQVLSNLSVSLPLLTLSPGFSLSFIVYLGQEVCRVWLHAQRIRGARFGLILTRHLDNLADNETTRTRHAGDERE